MWFESSVHCLFANLAEAAERLYFFLFCLTRIWVIAGACLSREIMKSTTFPSGWS